LVEEYLEYKRQYNQSLEKLGAASEEEAPTDETASGLYSSIKILNNELQELQEESARLLEEKAFLNKLFFSRYSRFIQEGTWLKEDYTDDEKYFIDA
jgi:predicted nuclease with TOPRIM domain